MKSAEKVVLYRLAASLLLTASTLHLLGLPAWPHGGGLDAHGCHHNRVQGGYHCHRGAFKGAMFDSKAEMLQALEASAPAVVQEFTGKVVGVSETATPSRSCTAARASASGCTALTHQRSAKPSGNALNSSPLI